MKWTLFILSCALLIAVGCSKSDVGLKVDNGKTAESLYPNVQATFTKSCVGCHGEKNPRQGIDLRSYDSILKGGAEGAVVVAGDPAKSVLVQSLRGAPGVKKMPLKGEPLTEAQIKEIETWIKDGAKK